MTEQQTPDREKKIAEIREALEKATAGPWKWIDSGGYDRKALVGEWEIMNFGVSAPYSEIAGQEPDDADAHLIANAPEWLRFLLDELEKRDEENQKLRKELDKQVEIGFSFECQLQSAQQEIERLREENEGRKKIIEAYMRIEHDLAEDAERYLQQRDKLIEVLRWYADAVNYEYRTSYLDQDAPILDDNGQRARDILREIGVTVE